MYKTDFVYSPLMKIIYSLAIKFYGFAVWAASHFNSKAKLWWEGRLNWQNKMRESIAKSDRVIWIHCSSLGEFEQGRPVMERIKSDFPNHILAVSFYSPSGYEVRKDYKGADYIFYLPLDTVQNARDLIEILHPEILILVKYEYWYNLLEQLQARHIPIVVISAVIKENSIFFRSGGGWFRRIISRIQHFFVQDLDSKNLLNSIQIQEVSVAGDTRFDRVKEIKEEGVRLGFMEKFKGDSKLVVAGSTWPDDEEIWLKFINQNLSDDWKVLLAPHNINSKQIEIFAQKLNKSVAIYTQSDEQQMADAQILIVDTVGMLTKIYAYADVSYVGGGFTKTGVHNTLEPAVFGKPVIFGPNYQNYFEAIELVERGGAISFKDQFDFDDQMKELIQNQEVRMERGSAAAACIEEKPNSTAMIMGYLKEKIEG